MTGVGDQEAVARVRPPWPGSGGRSARPAPARRRATSPRVKRAALACSVDQLREQGVYGVRVPLTGVLRDDVALRVDQHQRRPGPRGVGLPGHQLGVVEDRVPDLVPLDRGRQRRRVRLVLELRRVHPDHDQLVGVLLLDRPELVEHVQAVDAAERPEVEQHEAPAEVLDRVRPAGRVQPTAPDELGGTHARDRSHDAQSPSPGTPRTRVSPRPEPDVTRSLAADRVDSREQRPDADRRRAGRQRRGRLRHRPSVDPRHWQGTMHGRSAR